MKLVALLAITFLQTAVCSVAMADVSQVSSAVVVRLDAASTPGVQAAAAVQVAQGGMGDKQMDINVTVGEPMHSTTWYKQPIWIALFIVGGVAILSLLVMALRGSGSAGGATIVK